MAGDFAAHERQSIAIQLPTGQIHQKLTIRLPKRFQKLRDARHVVVAGANEGKQTLDRILPQYPQTGDHFRYAPQSIVALTPFVVQRCQRNVQLKVIAKVFLHAIGRAVEDTVQRRCGSFSNGNHPIGERSHPLLGIVHAPRRRLDIGIAITPIVTAVHDQPRKGLAGSEAVGRSQFFRRNVQIDPFILGRNIGQIGGKYFGFGFLGLFALSRWRLLVASSSWRHALGRC